METLNIEHHEKLLIIKALNKFHSHKEVWEALKVSERTLYRKMNVYNICNVNNTYQIGLVPTKKDDIAAVPKSNNPN